MKPVTVLETAPFIRAAADCLSDEQRQAFIDYIARKPEAGDLIQGTGGARKVRWARDGGGKSGGVRTIYYYHDEDVPLILLTVYPKNVKDNLTPSEKSAIKTAIEVIQAKIRTKRAASEKNAQTTCLPPKDTTQRT
jgi:hypothetical protein